MRHRFRPLIGLNEHERALCSVALANLARVGIQAQECSYGEIVLRCAVIREKQTIRVRR